MVGQSFNDPYAGVTITAAWATGTEAAVTVGFGPVSCVPANPTVAVSPSQSQSIQAGTAVTYTVSVTPPCPGGPIKGLYVGYPPERKVLSQVMESLLQRMEELNTPLSALRETLTEWEQEVVKWVIHGMTNKAIAAQRGISEKTVKAHLS